MEVFKMLCFRKMLKISWDREDDKWWSTKQDKRKTTVTESIKSRKDKIIEHILKYESLLKAIIEGDVEEHIER